ncbi:Polyadenylate-binding protein 8 [Hibiscus syriacus]|uniref:Polyadenylate-binding protein 8 n=1 Tax=Hibiscus syriacus TaxID=106335 RepID=A0A6A2ZQG7_HIBSY|nr:Polyadenylate-binding protein 8 [Hibiscus syriacus]
MAEVQVQAEVASVAATSTPPPHQQQVANVMGSDNGVSVTTSLYVGDLDPSVTESHLYDFSAHWDRWFRLGFVKTRIPAALLATVTLITAAHMKRNNLMSVYHCGGDRVFFLEDNWIIHVLVLKLFLPGFLLLHPLSLLPAEHPIYFTILFTSLVAARALDVVNFTPLNGKPIRIMYSNRDPTVRENWAGNIFIKNLDKTIDNKALHETFSAFGNILSCKIATDNSGHSKGYGFVQFDNEESAKSAIDKLNGMLINDKKVFVGPFLRKQERESSIGNTKFNNVYVKNLSESTTDEDLKNVFSEYGPITSVVVMKDADGKSKCFGFVNFENPDDAARSVDSLNGKKFDNKEWFVGKALKKSEREMELKGQYGQTLKETADKFTGLNLYVKNLDGSINDDKLRELFSEFGTVTSCKVMLDPNGISRGSGFVAFSTPEDASQALMEMNGKMVVSKPLYVAVAQRKEDRKARLQEQYCYMHPTAMGPVVVPWMPMYTAGTPHFDQQLFYGQGPHAIIPPQMLPTGCAYRYPPGRNMPDVPGRMLDAGGMPFRDAAFSQPMATGALASAPANATPVQKRTLGENLYHLVDQLEHDNARKVTGMLLEMDQTEVLHLLESPEALKAKVAEAMDVLRKIDSKPQQANSATDRLASLSLNENLVS